MLLALGIFVLVLLATALEWTHLSIAALLGATAMLLLGILSPPQAVASLTSGGGTIALLFGMMLVVRALESSGAFNGLAHQLVQWSGGQGHRLLLGLVILTVPVAAVLPNPSAVLLIAPLLPPLARELNLDFRPLLILMVLAANSASLLTLVGDPAIYIIGTGMGWNFLHYLQQITPVALLVIGALLLTLPLLYRKIWHTKLPITTIKPRPAHHKEALPWLLAVAALMLVLFVTGDSLPIPLDPSAVALGGAVATLFISHHSGLRSVDQLLADIDWATLIYFAAIFVLVGGLDRSGALNSLASQMAQRVTGNLWASSMWLLLVSAALSALIPNIPLVAALTPLLLAACRQGGLWTAGIPAEAAFPLFEALMLGVVIGGSATVIGSSSNLVAAGVARQHQSRIGFRTWLGFGLPTVALQLVVGWLYCWWIASGSTLQR